LAKTSATSHAARKFISAAFLPPMRTARTEPRRRTVITMNTTIQQQSQDQLEAVQRLYTAYGRGELDGVLAELADDVGRAAETASPSVPWYGRYHGKAEVPGFFQAIATSIDVTEFDLIGCTSNDPDVIVTVHWSYPGEGDR
jgi:hypothetical protein